MMHNAIENLRRFRRRGVLLDTNVFLVYLVGKLDRELVPKFKRTRNYRIEDFDLLENIIDPIEKLKITPQVATEIDNLAGNLSESGANEFRDQFSKLAPKVKESHFPIRSLCKTKSYKIFGLADSSIEKTARRSLILTDDLRLAVFIEKNRGNVINFTNLRAMQ